MDQDKAAPSDYRVPRNACQGCSKELSLLKVGEVPSSLPSPRSSSGQTRLKEPEAFALAAGGCVSSDQRRRVGDPEGGGVPVRRDGGGGRPSGAKTEVAPQHCVLLNPVLKEIAVAKVLISNVVFHQATKGSVTSNTSLKREILSNKNQHKRRSIPILSEI